AALRAGRHARRSLGAAAGRAHLHALEAAVGQAAGRRASVRGLLRPVEALARREPRAPARDPGTRALIPERALAAITRAGVDQARHGAVDARDLTGDAVAVVVHGDGADRLLAVDHAGERVGHGVADRLVARGRARVLSRRLGAALEAVERVDVLLHVAF